MKLSNLQDIAEAGQDCTITITSSKAKELNLQSGSIVGIIGRRRRVAYAVVNISKKGKKSSIQLSHNLASNLRIRDTDKVKIIPLGGDTEETGISEGASGDMALLATEPSVAVSVSFSPVRDSLHSLELSEGGDELSETEIKERFVLPYLNLEEGESRVVLKKGHTLILRDDNKKTLEFTVTNLELESDQEEDISEDVGESTVKRSRENKFPLCVVISFQILHFLLFSTRKLYGAHYTF